MAFLTKDGNNIEIEEKIYEIVPIFTMDGYTFDVLLSQKESKEDIQRVLKCTQQNSKIISQMSFQTEVEFSREKILAVRQNKDILIYLITQMGIVEEEQEIVEGLTIYQLTNFEDNDRFVQNHQVLNNI